MAFLKAFYLTITTSTALQGVDGNLLGYTADISWRLNCLAVLYQVIAVDQLNNP